MYWIVFSAAYRAGLGSSAFSEVIKTDGHRFLQLYDKDVSFESNGFVGASCVAGRTLFHVSIVVFLF